MESRLVQVSVATQTNVAFEDIGCYSDTDLKDKNSMVFNILKEVTTSDEFCKELTTVKFVGIVHFLMAAFRGSSSVTELLQDPDSCVDDPVKVSAQEVLGPRKPRIVESVVVKVESVDSSDSSFSKRRNARSKGLCIQVLRNGIHYLEGHATSVGARSPGNTPGDTNVTVKEEVVPCSSHSAALGNPMELSISGEYIESPIDEDTVYQYTSDDTADGQVYLPNIPASSATPKDQVCHKDTTQGDNESDATDESSISQSNSDVTRSRIFIRNKVHVCGICRKSFRHASALRCHVRTHTGEKPFRCMTCEKTFSQKGHYNIHQRIHTGEKPYICPICGRSFTEKRLLQRHEMTHTGETPFVCDSCGKRFVSSTDLRSHAVLTHSGSKPFICGVSEKDFTGERDHGVHMVLSSVATQHQCETCGKVFAQRGHLTVHMRIHTGERPYRCDTCGKSFGEKSVLERHMKSHTGDRPFPCSFCEKNFYSKSDLRAHTRTHTGEKPFLCSTCGRRFRESGTLTTHMRMHTGEKPYTCPICGEHFARNGDMKRHLVRQHGHLPDHCDTEHADVSPI